MTEIDVKKLAKEHIKDAIDSLNVEQILATLDVEQVTVRLGELLQHPYNPRRGSVPKIKESIKANGYYPSIFYQKSTSYIIKGNHTDRALHELNDERKTKGRFEHYKANCVDCDDATAMRILLMDNRTGDESSYDTEVLYKALVEADEINSTALFGTGWSEESMEALARQIGVKTDLVDMTKEDRTKFINEETGRETLTRDDVPDAIFESNNEFDIPVLKLNFCADFVDAPVFAWGGQRGRKGKVNVGTYHFYTTDSHIEPLWGNPTQILNTVVKTVTEVNFSVLPQTPRAMVLYHTYRKRWIARYLQANGVKIIVDLTVSEEHAELNLIGVPKGWRAFSSRASAMLIEDGTMDKRLARARKIAGTDDIIFLVVGGSKSVEQWCIANGLTWIPDEMAVSRGAADTKLELKGKTKLENVESLKGD